MIWIHFWKFIFGLLCVTCGYPNYTRLASIISGLLEGRFPYNSSEVTMTMDWAVEKNFPEAGNIKEVAQAVLDGYRSGNPVVVFDDKGKLLHGREHLEAGIASGDGITAFTIYSGLSQQEFWDSGLPEWCEAARTVFMADQFPQQEG